MNFSRADRRGGEKIYSQEDVEDILRNVGVNVECGACMCQAFTGSNGYEHTCGKKFDLIMIVGPASSAGEDEDE